MATWWLPPGSDSRLQPAPSLVLTAALVQGKSDIISKHLHNITVHRGLWGAEGDYKHVYRHGVVVAARYNGLGY